MKMLIKIATAALPVLAGCQSTDTRAPATVQKPNDETCNARVTNCVGNRSEVLGTRDMEQAEAGD